MFDFMERKRQVTDSLQNLLADSKARPFLFRTRFERTIIRLMSLARDLEDKDLEQYAKNALNKMRGIVDKSNCTSDGVLRSFTILEADIFSLLNLLKQTNNISVS